MAKVPVYNYEGQLAGDVSVSDAIFGVKANPTLIHEVVVADRANRRRAVASTKTRGEVRGGGKKPWKQKGTGRARQGSIRSPQWVGGGITFGPTSERNFSLKINKKAKKKALFMALSDKLAHAKIFALEGIKTEPAKTRVMATLLKKLPVEKTVLMVAPGPQAALVRMVRNLQHVKIVTAQSVSLLDVLGYRTVIFLKDAVPVFEKMYA